MKNIHILTVLLIALLFLSCGGEDENDNPETIENKAEWLTDAFEVIPDYSRIKAVCYWNESWEQYGTTADLRINSSTISLDSYSTVVQDEYFLSEVLTDSELKIIPSTTGCYHCAYPGFYDDVSENVRLSVINEFEANAGKNLAWVYFSDTWHDGIEFPSEKVQVISDASRIPFIRLMAWSAYQIEGVDPTYTMQAFIDGDFDDELTQYAISARNTGIPIMLEFGTEVNGDWFPWNGNWNGGGTLDGYGDPEYPDGAERFRDAYRHIIQIFNDNNANNVTWAFHVNLVSSPDEQWNHMHYYYPGDDYIDWIGISIYGPINSNDPDNYTFQEMLEYVWTDFSEISSEKPLALFEFGVGEF